MALITQAGMVYIEGPDEERPIASSIVSIGTLFHPTDGSPRLDVLSYLSGIKQWVTVATTGANVYNVKDPAYGAVGDGITNDAPAIQLAIEAASAAGGGTVYIPPGSYKLATALTLRSNVSLVGEGPGVSILLQAYWPSASAYGVTQGGTNSNQAVATVQATGTAGTSLTCSAVAAGDFTISGISSTAGIARGDVLILGSEDLFANSTRRRGELIVVMSLGILNSGTGIFDNPTTSLTIRSVAHDAYTTSPKIVPFTAVKNIIISGLEFRNTEPGLSRQFFITDVAAVDASAGSHSTALLGFKYAKTIKIDRCKFQDFDYAALRMTYTWEGSVTNCEFVNGTDNSPNEQFGYGILLESACDSVVMANSRFHRSRHSMTTGSVSSSGFFGAPRNWIFASNTVTETSNSGIDTHIEGGQGLIVGNYVGSLMYKPRTGSGSGQAGGIHVRSYDTHIIDNLIDWVGSGIDLDGNAVGCIIQGNVIRHVLDSAGISLGSSSGVVERVVVTRNTLDQIATHGVRVLSPTSNNLMISENTIINCGTASLSDGINFASGITSTGHKILGNRFWKYAASTEPDGKIGNLQYGVNQLSATVTASHIANNMVMGATLGAVNDVGSNQKWNNQRIDVALDLRSQVSNIPSCEDNDLTAWVYDIMGSGGATAMVSGEIYFLKIPIRVIETIGSVFFSNSVIGTSMVVGQCLAGVYSSAGTKLGETADISGTPGYGDTQVQKVALLTTVTVTPPFVWVALLANFSGTAPSLVRGSGQGSFGNVGLTGTTKARFGVAATGAIALPASVTPATIVYNTATRHYWAGIGP